MKKRQNFEDERMKRPERPLYIPPAFRSKSNEECENKMNYAKDKYANETPNTQAYFLEKHDSSQKRCNEIVSKRLRFDSSGSSSEPKNTSDESYKDYDSSDFEDCCDFVPMDDLNISKETNESNSDDNWGTGGRRSARYLHGVETENYQNDDKIPNRILMQHEGYSDVNSYANQRSNAELNETKLDRGLFDNYDDSISDIEAVIDSYIKKGSVLTSTPKSDVVEQKVLNAANYTPEEDSDLQSTLLGQTDIHENMNSTSRNKCGNNFDIYHDSPLIENQPPDYTEIFGNNYIPPPVPPPTSIFRWPSIPRLQSPISSPYELFAPRRISLYNTQPLLTQLRRPRQIFVSSFRLCPDAPRISPAHSSSCLPSMRHHIPSPCLRPAAIPPPNVPRMFSSTPPAVLPQEIINSPRSPQGVFNPLHLHRRSLNAENLPTYKREDSFYIPPPISPPQLMDGSQQINLSLRQNVQKCLPSSSSLTNKMVCDAKIWPQNLNMKNDYYLH